MLYPNKNTYLKLISLVFVLLIGCKLSNTYIPDERRNYIINEKYSFKDTLFIKNYILYGNADVGTIHNPWKRVELNSDSLIDIFKISISKIESINVCVNKPLFNRVKSDSYRSNPLLKYKKIDRNEIISLARIGLNEISLIPVINFSFYSTRWSGSGQSDTYPRFICHFNIAVFIVKNEEIIYYKQMRYVEKVNSEFYPYEFEDFHIPIPQKHWDGLVREVMKEYIERLE